MQSDLTMEEILMWPMYMPFLAPVISSLLLGMALFPGKGHVLRKVFFHVLAMPLLYALTVVLLRQITNPWNGLFFYTLFVLFMYLYLVILRQFKKYRNR